MINVTNNAGIAQTMQLIDSIGEDAYSIFKSFKTQSTQRGIVQIMSNADMDADQKEKAMLQLPFATENEAFKLFRAEQVRKRQTRSRIDYQVQLKDELYQQTRQRRKDQGFTPEEMEQADRYEAGIAARPSTAQAAKKYFPAVRNGKKVMIVIDPVTLDEVGEIAVGDIESKSLPDQLKHWTTELDKARGQYYGHVDFKGGALDPITFEFANEQIKKLIQQLKGGVKPTAGPIDAIPTGDENVMTAHPSALPRPAMQPKAIPHQKLKPYWKGMSAEERQTAEQLIKQGYDIDKIIEALNG